MINTQDRFVSPIKSNGLYELYLSYSSSELMACRRLVILNIKRAMKYYITEKVDYKINGFMVSIYPYQSAI